MVDFADLPLKEQIVTLLLNQQGFYKNFASDLTKQKEELLEKEDVALHPTIKEQYIEQVKQLIINEITKQIACAAEPVREVLDSVDNFETYINM